ncbi:MAG: GspH/FimT family protein [Betaproteobacteria bacterium]|nr:GspH/FimT family protein [Betaproteobacteria bacterium]
MVILAIVAAIAAPNFNRMIESWRVRQASETLSSTLYYARSEAIKRGGNVAVKFLDSGGSSGWEVVCVNNACGTDDTVLQQYVTPAGLNIGASAIVFNRWGLVDGGSSFSVMAGSSIKNVCLGAAGRVHISGDPC